MNIPSILLRGNCAHSPPPTHTYFIYAAAVAGDTSEEKTGARSRFARRADECQVNTAVRHTRVIRHSARERDRSAATRQRSG